MFHTTMNLKICSKEGLMFSSPCMLLGDCLKSFVLLHDDDKIITCYRLFNLHVYAVECCFYFILMSFVDMQISYCMWNISTKKYSIL